MPERVELYFWNAEDAPDYPPSEAQVCSFPEYYAERYRAAKAEAVRQQATGSAFLLRTHLGITQDTRLLRGEHGRLQLSDDPRHLSISHSGPWTVLAVADHPVGVDIELLSKEPFHHDTTVKRFFPPSMRIALEAAPEEEKQRVFLECWTRLEAAVKADGRGLTIPRQEFEELLQQYTISTEYHGPLIVSVATPNQ